MHKYNIKCPDPHTRASTVAFVESWRLRDLTNLLGLMHDPSGRSVSSAEDWAAMEDGDRGFNDRRSRAFSWDGGATKNNYQKHRFKNRLISTRKQQQMLNIRSKITKSENIWAKHTGIHSQNNKTLPTSNIVHRVSCCTREWTLDGSSEVMFQIFHFIAENFDWSIYTDLLDVGRSYSNRRSTLPSEFWNLSRLSYLFLKLSKCQNLIWSHLFVMIFLSTYIFLCI